MDRSPLSSVSAPPNTTLQRALQVVGLCSVGIMQPILDAVAGNWAYQLEADLQWPELLGMLAVLGVAIPLTAVALDAGVVRLASRTRGYGRDAVIFALVLATVLSLLRPLLTFKALSLKMVVWLVTIAVAAPITWGAMRVYRHSRAMRRWLAISAAGTLLFPAVFALRIVRPAPEKAALLETVSVGNPAPVVLVVFDEFTGHTLMQEDLALDRDRFPQFGRLADTSTWYRNATSVHARTHLAVPAILSGRFPTVDCSPTPEHYPNNLIDLLSRTAQYDLAVFEPITRLYQRAAARRLDPGPSGQRFANLLHTIAVVYPRLLLPRDTPVELPPVPRNWFGTAKVQVDDLDLTTGRFHHAWDLQRDVQLEHFLRCVTARERSAFYLLHVVLPHYPWCHYSSGRAYQRIVNASANPLIGRGDLGEDWPDDAANVARAEQRYLLQLGFIDRFIGRLQDRLQEQGLWDASLLIVTGDHGVSFRPGHSRRIPDAETLPDLMSVPLFVKLPGQTAGRIDDRNVETVDILPTILDVLELNCDEPRDGSSLRSDVVRPRKTFYFENGMTVAAPDLPQKVSAIRRHRALFGQLPLEALPAMTCSRPAWLGKGTTAFAIQDRTINSLEFNGLVLLPKVDPEPFLLGLVEGTFVGSDFPGTPRDVVVAVDGVIVDVCAVSTLGFDYYGFSVLLPEALLSTRGRQIEVFLAATGNDGELHRINSRTL